MHARIRLRRFVAKPAASTSSIRIDGSGFLRTPLQPPLGAMQAVANLSLQLAIMQQPPDHLVTATRPVPLLAYASRAGSSSSFLACYDFIQASAEPTRRPLRFVRSSSCGPVAALAMSLPWGNSWRATSVTTSCSPCPGTCSSSRPASALVESCFTEPRAAAVLKVALATLSIGRGFSDLQAALILQVWWPRGFSNLH